MKINWKKEVGTCYALSLVTLLALTVGFFAFISTKNLRFAEPEIVIAKRIHKKLGSTIVKPPPPPPVSMQRLKTQGCVADGLLSEYNPDSDNFSKLINRSNCYYLHRAVETWLKPPDFDTISFEMDQIKKPDVVYGMFIAEAINVRAHYLNAEENREFDFKAMCRKGSDNIWGEGTCKPTFSSKEYRDYLEYITERAIDSGVQSFTFGQIYMQEGVKKDYAPKIVKKIREYAKKKNVDIVIGAQTGAITDPKYLALFDYIEGGVGLKEDGSVEDGPCLSTRGSCWALLWHKNFSAKAKNVLLHLDWTGIPSDDLDIFARMDQATRAQTLQNLYKKFSTSKTGFLMPLMGVLDKDNDGCHGPKKRFYSPDNAYSCKDEGAINAILAGKNLPSDLSQKNSSEKNF